MKPAEELARWLYGRFDPSFAAFHPWADVLPPYKGKWREIARQLLADPPAVLLDNLPKKGADRE